MKNKKVQIGIVFLLVLGICGGIYKYNVDLTARTIAVYDAIVLPTEEVLGTYNDTEKATYQTIVEQVEEAKKQRKVAELEAVPSKLDALQQQVAARIEEERLVKLQQEKQEALNNMTLQPGANEQETAIWNERVAAVQNKINAKDFATIDEDFQLLVKTNWDIQQRIDAEEYARIEAARQSSYSSYDASSYDDNNDYAPSSSDYSAPTGGGSSGGGGGTPAPSCWIETDEVRKDYAWGGGTGYEIIQRTWRVCSDGSRTRVA